MTPVDGTGNVRVTQFTVERLDDDPLTLLRASIGGRQEIGFYLSFRGDPDEVVDMLERVLLVAKASLPVGHFDDNRAVTPPDATERRHDD